MIKINKPTAIPETLRGEGRSEKNELCKAFDANPTAYYNGTKKFEFESEIYGSVKRELKEAQHKKCMYCEFKQTREVGVVEHFRPKGAFKQKIVRGRKEYPGYYWLAYDWDNLYFSCGPCNTKKGICFPIKNIPHRARNHNEDCTREEPLLIDPGKEDPRRHIRFNREKVEGKTLEGMDTIKICGLDDDNLNELRKEWIEQLETIQKLADDPGLKGDPDEANKFLMEAMEPNKKFSSMVIDFLREETSD